MYDRLLFKHRIVLSHVRGCQQSIWTNDATKVACRWLKKILNLLRNSYKTMVMTATKDISLRLMLVILSVDKRYIAISHPCLKEWRLINARNLFVICMTSKTVSSHKSHKECLRLRTDTRKSA